MSGADLKANIEAARREADCFDLDLRDALAAKATKDVAMHLNNAIRRHGEMAHRLAGALNEVDRRQQVLSGVLPDNLRHAAIPGAVRR